MKKYRISGIIELEPIEEVESTIVDRTLPDIQPVNHAKTTEDFEIDEYSPHESVGIEISYWYD